MTAARMQEEFLEPIRYEHPLNERIRTMMRLEVLFSRARHFIAQDAPQEHHAALGALFEITDVASRADLKSELIQELERQKQVLAPLRSNPGIDQDMLEALLGETDMVAGQMLAQQGKAGMHLRENEWLMGIKQRMAIPGGVCEFDLPAYHYWLNRGAAARRGDFLAWIEPFAPLAAGCSIVLRLLRENGRASQHVAQRGSFQLMMTTSKASQLLRLALSRELPVVPEVSANKYALNIRFIGASGMDRGTLYDQDVEFELTFCNL